jgi:hypothetical protein
MFSFQIFMQVKSNGGYPDSACRKLTRSGLSKQIFDNSVTVLFSGIVP